MSSAQQSPLPSSAPSSAPPPASSSAVPPTSAPSSVPPTTSQPPTSAPPSSSAPQSSAAPSSTPGSSAPPAGSSVAPSAAPSSGTSAPPPNSSVTSAAPGSSNVAQSPTVITRTVTSTRPDGSVSTGLEVVSSSVPGSGNTGGGESKNNTGAIAGGVVGGVVGLALILGLVWFFLKKRRRSYRDDFDDMMFDPARKQNQGRVDLGDDAGPNTVEPFYAPGPASTAQGHSPEMSQQPRSAAATSDSGGYGYGDHGVSRGPSSASTGGFAGYGAGGGYANPQPLETMPEASHYVTGAAGGSGGAGSSAAAGALGGAAGAAGVAGMSAKQREAYQERQRAHQQQYPPQPSSNYGGNSPTQETAVASDAGPWSDDSPTTQGGEIPPTYDSIRR